MTYEGETFSTDPFTVDVGCPSFSMTTPKPTYQPVTLDWLYDNASPEVILMSFTSLHATVDTLCPVAYKVADETTDTAASIDGISISEQKYTGSLMVDPKVEISPGIKVRTMMTYDSIDFFSEPISITVSKTILVPVTVPDFLQDLDSATTEVATLLALHNTLTNTVSYSLVD
jgi:hypothetical protein